MNHPDTLLYSDTHEWLSVHDGIGTVGITDHAQNALSDVVFVELPKPGKVVKRKDPTAAVESVKAASDIYAPVSGEIIEVNSGLSQNPEWVNGSPYEQGWIFKIKLSQPEETSTLKKASDYVAGLGH
ncbi:MAG: glycine cleavage system protein GcvH [Blastochloris sp.]|nr:glycine cleavage system protein GcvH [Blastochloris sp.]